MCRREHVRREGVRREGVRREGVRREGVRIWHSELDQEREGRGLLRRDSPP